MRLKVVRNSDVTPIYIHMFLLFSHYYTNHLTKPQNLAKLMGTHPPDPFNVQERHPLSHEQQQWHSSSGHPQGHASSFTTKRQTASRNMDVKGYLCVLFGRFTLR